jgi:hypothetical protein
MIPLRLVTMPQQSGLAFRHGAHAHWRWVLHLFVKPGANTTNMVLHDEIKQYNFDPV